MSSTSTRVLYLCWKPAPCQLGFSSNHSTVIQQFNSLSLLQPAYQVAGWVNSVQTFATSYTSPLFSGQPILRSGSGVRVRHQGQHSCSQMQHSLIRHRFRQSGCLGGVWWRGVSAAARLRYWLRLLIPTIYVPMYHPSSDFHNLFFWCTFPFNSQLPILLSQVLFVVRLSTHTFLFIAVLYSQTLLHFVDPILSILNYLSSF